MLPEAHISHSIATRLRIKIPERKGEAEYFSQAKTSLSRFTGQESVEVNPATGSVLIQGPELNLPSVAEFARQEGLFQLDTSEYRPAPLSKRVAQPLGEMSESVSRFTKGEIDFAGLAFLALIGVGLYQIIRGGFRAPPWYTAFWYALGMLSKAAVDKNNSDS